MLVWVIGCSLSSCMSPRVPIVPIQWGKLLVNLANSVNAMAGIPFKRQVRFVTRLAGVAVPSSKAAMVTLMLQLRDPVFRDITASLMEEGLTVLRAAQIEPVSTNPLRKPWLLPHLLRLPTSLFFLLLRYGSCNSIDLVHGIIYNPYLLSPPVRT